MLTLTNDDLIITPDSPRLAYYQRSKEEKSAIHWGQRKLLLSEIQFFTNYPSDSTIVVYAGAAPGIHIPYLSSLFPQLIFHLYDPNPFAKNSANKKIFIYNQLFTDQDAKSWANKNVYFISDIRSVDYHKVSEKEVEESIDYDMLLQKKWVEIIKPVYSLLKFRLPWPDRWPSKTYQYLSGTIYKQVWAPQSSTETRLVPTKGVEEYDILKYEEQMFYQNAVVRETFRYVNDTDTELGNDFDSAAETLIISNYLKTTHSVDIINMSREMTKHVSSLKLKSLSQLRKNTNYTFKGKNVKIIDYPILLQDNPDLLLSINERLIAEPDFIQDLNQTLNKNNFITSPAYLNEVNLYTTSMTHLIKNAINEKGYTLDNLLHVDILQPTLPVTETISLVYDENIPVRNLVQRDKVKKPVDLKKRLKDVEEGKILNISNISSSGTKTAVIKMTGRKDWFTTKDEMIITNNLNALKTFIDLYTQLYPNDKKLKRFEKELKRAEKHFNKQ